MDCSLRPPRGAALVSHPFVGGSPSDGVLPIPEILLSCIAAYLGSIIRLGSPGFKVIDG
jgi:hypothetical protein